MTAKGHTAKTLVELTMKLIQHHEKCAGARIRARRPADQGLHLRRVEAIVCNLAHAVLLPPPTGRIAVQLGHGRKGRSRYDSPIMGKPLSPLLSGMWKAGILEMKKWPVIRGEVSSMAPTTWFASKVAEFGIQLSDFGRDDEEESIVLTRNIRGRNGSLQRDRIDYADNVSTRADREAVRFLNAFLADANITFIDDGLEPRIDPFDRTIKRRYVIRKGQGARFDQSGRLYGGFWQNLKKGRRRNIRIGGERVGVLDYGSMHTRLAYADVGAVPSEGDLYAIPGLEGYRSGVKLAMNIFLSDESARRRSWPKEMGVGVGDDRAAYEDPYSKAAGFDGRLPEGWTVKRLKDAVLKVHPPLKKAWGQKLGLTLMHQESEILLAILLELASRGIPALGLHDGLITAQSHMEIAREVMERQGHALTGILLPVSSERLN